CGDTVREALRLVAVGQGLCDGRQAEGFEELERLWEEAVQVLRRFTGDTSAEPTPPEPTPPEPTPRGDAPGRARTAFWKRS
ncbi:MAG: hypothetical protein ACRDTM_12955, partial [Micromonosporaceae bacterium]